jgi:16S rRNA (cytosine967-C5)-methyltransferase
VRPSARVQAAIELLDEIILSARDAGPPADIIVQRFFQRRRYAGSGDRRAIRELAYRVIRRFGERPLNGRAAMLGLAQEDPELLPLFDYSLRAPVPPIPGEPITEGDPIPGWLAPLLDSLLGEAEISALLDRATLDLRANRLRGSREAALAEIAGSTPTELSPIGLRPPEGFRTEASEVWKSGLVEVQDEGSQLISLACEAAPGASLVDLCAGGGGKTLALAAEMANQGAILACDADRARLSRLPPRAERAGATIIETRLLNPRKELDALADWRGRADIVLVDAPCSGSGTWRRNPETRWRLDQARLDRVTNLQAYLLDVALELVRPGGHLVYAVCSVLSPEGRQQAEAFGARRSGLIIDPPPIGAGRGCGPGILLTPESDGTDGFFVARWRTPC